MKQPFLTCLLFLLFPVSQQAQDSSGFFPHHVGDLWEYYYWDGIVEGIVQDCIIQDSIDQDGNTHLLMKRNTYIPGWPQMSIPWYDHYRIDSAGNVLAGLGQATERHLYKAEVDLWGIWIVEVFPGSGYDLARLEDVRSAIVFEISSTVREIVYYGASTPAETTA